MTESDVQQRKDDEQLNERVIKSFGAVIAGVGLMLAVAESGQSRLSGLGMAACGLLAVNAMYLRRILRALRK